MLSSKFIRLVESHAEEIAESTLRQLAEDPRTPHLARRPWCEQIAECAEIIRDLGQWLVHGGDENVAERFEPVGARCAAQGIPASELVYALHVLKAKMLDLIRNQGLAQSSVDLYAEEELEHHAGRLFDSIVYHVVNGYESAAVAEAAAAAAGDRSGAPGPGGPGQSR